MKTSNNSSETIDFETPEISPTNLPPFLNVLTILTFVGSGMGIPSAFYSLFTENLQRELMEDSRSEMEQLGEIGADLLRAQEVALDNNVILQISAIVAGMLCVLGAVYMRKLLKTGFYFYVLGCVIAVAIPAMYLGFGLMGYVLLISSFITIAFLIMYAVNLKYLK
jgi:hypothetical protein